jgi:predicted RNase H-like HicB family nuclease
MGVAMECKIDFELEEDGRWIAEAVEMPGVLAYGSTQDEARSNVEALAKRVALERTTREN